MQTLLQDLKFAARMLAKNAGLTLTAVITLALGIGANTAIFSVLSAVLLRPLPYPHPEHLVKVWGRFTGIGLPKDQMWFSVPEYRDLNDLNRSFSEIACATTNSFNMGVNGTPEQIAGANATPSLFRLLGVNAQIGRTFTEEEGQLGHDSVVLVSYGLWQRGFAGDAGVVGRTLQINGQPMTVVGVLPKWFTYPGFAGIEMWQPLAFTPAQFDPNSRGNHGYEVVARLKPGVTLAQARAELASDAKSIIEQNKQYPYVKFDYTLLANPLLDEVVGDEMRSSLWILMAAVGFVLLIACANVASLLLSRAAARDQETAVRMTLGAGRGRLVRQHLTESVLLALIGGAAGVATVPVALRALVALSEKTLPRPVETTVDVRMLLFSLGVALGTGLLFGLVPALRAVRGVRFSLLKEGGRGGSMGMQSSRSLRLLVAGEAAVCLVLLAGGGLLLRSFLRVLDVDPGFRPAGVLTMQVTLPSQKYSKTEQLKAFFHEALNRIRALPGVQSAGAISGLPLSDNPNSGTLTVDTTAVPADQRGPETDYRGITPGYMEAMGIKLVEGRFFDQHDSESGQPVAIVDESLAHLYWPNESALGKRAKVGGAQSATAWMTIVGVVRHVHYASLETRSRVELYWPYAQMPFQQSQMDVVVKTSGDPQRLAGQIEAAIHGIDPDQPVFHVRTMEEWMADAVARRKLALDLLGIFAGLALVLAAVGIYGTTSFSVTQQTREIGVRRALGAQTSGVLRMVLMQEIRVVGVGILAGLAGALAMTQLMKQSLFDVSAADPVTYLAVMGILAAVAVAAALLPALRATRIEPLVALRYE
ncbi:MAG TPA: ABC transporter permease [Candidatus Acidoferrales bacterium]|nr:ABC transporter permease [Candidatus Acidoferrales bacterium]